MGDAACLVGGVISMSSTVVDAMIVVDDEDDNNFVPILGEKELT